MNAKDTLAMTRKRIGIPKIWVAMTILALPYFLGYMGANPSEAIKHPILLITFLVYALGIGAGYCLTSPIPWQWTGNGHPMTPWWRGLLQSLVFNGLLVMALGGLCRWVLVLNGIQFQFSGAFHSKVLVNATLTAMIMALVGSIIASFEVSRMEKAEARAEADKARWLLLKGQLGPHVLYNTLNALAELIRRDPMAAERVVLDLSELFERISSHGERVISPLREERIILERYLSIQKLTLGEKLDVAWVWDASLDEIQVPPLLLQPLVENALKHGLSEHVRGGLVRIEGSPEKGGWVRFRVCNTGAPLRSSQTQGVGLANLNHRIALAYGEGARFQLATEGGETVATLWLRPDSLRIKP